MKLDAARIVLRPRSMSETLDLALRFCTEPAAKLYAKLSAATLLPAYLATVAVYWFLDLDPFDVWLLALAIVTPLQGVFTVAVGRMMFAEDIGAAEVLGQYMRRLPAYLGTLILTRLLIALTSLGFFLIIPPLWGWAQTTFSHEACLLEQAGPSAAFKRGQGMVKVNAMSTAGLLLLMSLAAMAFVMSAEGLFNYGLLEFVLQLGMPLGSLFDDGISMAALLGLFLVVPFWSTARFLAYVDQRTRRDGWDVQLRFMAIQVREQGQQHQEARA
ncbi:hypothetical protein PPSIR1_30988 [Plesiocystis pacifica SIR-1]|uniref:Glycerophosphoryl diester phosphodiesterase membrane domain-containing protein n=1 Tax=Plesiocystis pacifica SIR-1 TaxID=391625 RepID=A6GG76_9BACT|nr:hypothetical protein [Plesiocystis pacifica]EDM75145.1 hypothetical protein PPSIR1_30988 [Plesiocystis pacifica SIR-1]